MPDYGDDRGFRSRGVPSDIGFDRAGPVRGTNYNEGYRPGDVTVSNVPFNPRSTFNRDTPVQMGGSRGEFAPPLYSGRNPFIQPIQTGGRLGEFSQGIFGGSKYAANDIVNAIMDGMNKSQGAGAKLMAEADSYTPQNLIQMYEDALDAGNEDEAEMYLNDLQLRYPTLVSELSGNQGDSMDEIQLAKIYQSTDPGMIDEGFFWDSLTPEAEAINKVLNIPGVEGMRKGSVDDWNYEDFRKMVPENLWNELPDDAFETLSDFRNQGIITT